MANCLSDIQVPEGVTVTPSGVIECTRDALSRLGDWCRKNAGSLTVAVFATTNTNAVLSQTPPSGTQVATATVPALTPSVKRVGYGQMTQDGREFAKLTEKEVDGLTRTEKKAYYAWKNAELDVTIVSEDRANEGKKTTINQITSQNADIAQTAAKVFPIYEQLIVKQGHLKTLSPEAKELIQVIAKYKRPPGFVEQAEKFVKYI